MTILTLAHSGRGLIYCVMTQPAGVVTLRFLSFQCSAGVSGEARRGCGVTGRVVSCRCSSDGVRRDKFSPGDCLSLSLSGQQRLKAAKWLKQASATSYCVASLSAAFELAGREPRRTKDVCVVQVCHQCLSVCLFVCLSFVSQLVGRVCENAL